MYLPIKMQHMIYGQGNAYIFEQTWFVTVFNQPFSGGGKKASAAESERMMV